MRLTTDDASEPIRRRSHSRSRPRIPTERPCTKHLKLPSPVVAWAERFNSFSTGGQKRQRGPESYSLTRELGPNIHTLNEKDELAVKERGRGRRKSIWLSALQGACSTSPLFAAQLPSQPAAAAGRLRVTNSLAHKAANCPAKVREAAHCRRSRPRRAADSLRRRHQTHLLTVQRPSLFEGRHCDHASWCHPAGQSKRRVATTAPPARKRSPHSCICLGRRPE
jgi:hypothetical protein